MWPPVFIIILRPVFIFKIDFRQKVIHVLIYIHLSFYILIVSFIGQAVLIYVVYQLLVVFPIAVHYLLIKYVPFSFKQIYVITVYVIIRGRVMFINFFSYIEYSPVFPVNIYIGWLISLNIQIHLSRQQALHKTIPKHGMISIIP